MKIKGRILIYLFWLMHFIIVYVSLPERVQLIDRVLIFLILFLVHFSFSYILSKYIWNRTVNSSKMVEYFLWIVLLGFISAPIIFFPINYFFEEYNLYFYDSFNRVSNLLISGATVMVLLLQSVFKMSKRLNIYDNLGTNSEQMAELDAVSSRNNETIILDHVNSILAKGSNQEVEAVSKMRNHMKMVSYLYSDTAKKELLTKEIQFLLNYKELISSEEPELEYRVSFDYDGKIEVKRIPPLILFPFYEKAMYYAQTEPQNSHLKSLVYGESGFIRFQIFTEYPETIKVDADIMKGLNTRIGSAKRRLMLAYPDNHELVINHSEKTFNVFLRINV